jgi:outer membrane autotransporter protein
MNAFVRFYSSEGDVDLAHTAGNFGQGGNFGFSQKTWGKEFGINANFSDTLHAGLVLGNADSRQRLSEGVGENRMDGATVGAYATWQVPEGFYVDLTGRWMAADVRATSAAGVMAGRVHTQATSLEAGYEWKIGAVNVVPQAQYTRTKVDGITLFHGEMADFEAHGGTFSQGRIGVEINKTLQSGDLRWTPYGALSAVREFDGKTTYTVADNFFGSTNSKGTSAMAELGLSLQKGAFGFGLGVNWTDGGAYKSVVGGQANVRFSW